MNKLKSKEVNLSIQRENILNKLEQTKNEWTESNFAKFSLEQLQVQNEELKKEVDYLKRQLVENQATSDKYLHEEQKKLKDAEAKLTQQVEANNKKQRVI
ncbi:hypothetical protein GLOIN_2v1704752, partial [Rhizophagus irregularis DAOM 181602=DAOM 197198]